MDFRILGPVEARADGRALVEQARSAAQELGMPDWATQARAALDSLHVG